MQKKRKHNKIYLYRAGFFVLLFCAAIFTAACGREVTIPSYDEEMEPADEISMFAIVCNVDEVNEKITLRAVSYATEITLSYNGGADILDKYGDVLSISGVELGSIADIVYDANRDKLLSLHVSADENIVKAEAVSGAVIDNVENTLRMNGRTYPMNENVKAFSDNSEIGLDEICSEDQLTVWLYNDVVCSLYVELGHGYVRLSDYASYLGGMVEIGYDVIVPVTEDMLLTVREGEYTLRIAKGSDIGTKSVKVVKNQETKVSLADIAVEPKQMGSVLFKITPSDAAVYVDGRKVNTEGAVDIAYGKHRLDIQAEGYQSYSASFKVDYAYKVKEYTLLEEGATTEGTTSTSSKSTSGATTTEKTTADGSTENETTEKTTEKDGTSTDSSKTSNKVTVSAPVGASVYFDGEYLGIAPITFTKVTGSHIITFSKAGYLSKSYTVTFTDDGKDVPLSYSELISIASLIE